MNMCANHAEKPAVAYCRSCGKPLCELCRVEEFGAIYCSEDAPAAKAAASAFTTPPPPPPHTGYAQPPMAPYAASPYDKPSGPSPAAATILGFIPGVGAIYNGQYAKGLIHAVVFGLLVTIASSDTGPEPLVGISIAIWCFYMVIEAYHTAQKKRAGVPVDELSSIINLRGVNNGMPIGAIVLISLGVLLLLNTTGLIPMDRIMRYWPAGLILLGVYMLYARVDHRTSVTAVHPAVQELTDERQ